MKKTVNDFYKNPSLKNVIIFYVIWFVSNMLLILVITDLFTESFFQKKYLMMYILMIGSTISTRKIYMNYRKNKKLAYQANVE